MMISFLIKNIRKIFLVPILCLVFSNENFCQSGFDLTFGAAKVEKFHSTDTSEVTNELDGIHLGFNYDYYFQNSISIGLGFGYAKYNQFLTEEYFVKPMNEVYSYTKNPEYYILQLRIGYEFKIYKFIFLRNFIGVKQYLIQHGLKKPLPEYSKYYPYENLQTLESTTRLFKSRADDSYSKTSLCFYPDINLKLNNYLSVLVGIIGLEYGKEYQYVDPEIMLTTFPDYCKIGLNLRLNKKIQ